MQFPLHYPLTFKFIPKWLSIQFAIRDAHGDLIAHVKTSLSNKEVLTVFADEHQTQSLYTFKRDNFWAFLPRVQFFDQSGMSLGSVKQSRWVRQPRFDIFDGDTVVMTICRQKNRVDWLVLRPDGTVVMRMKLGRQGALEKEAALSEAEERRVLLSLIYVTLAVQG